MAIITLLISFILVFFNTGILVPKETGRKEVLLCSVLVFSALIIAITELLSALHAITYTGIFAAWTIITALNMLYLYTKKQHAVLFWDKLKQRVVGVYKTLDALEKIFFYLTLFILLLVFVQGIIYPPNNWDSMSYHMARIPDWISHRSVMPYPTHIVRQLYQPPFAEYAIMHMDILNRSDYFSSVVQFFFLIFSAAAVVAIAKQPGLGRQYQLMVFILAATLPEALLQASGTQNDVVLCFFTLSCCYFAIKAIEQPVLKNYLFLGLSIAIGILTKATAYLYMAPVLLIFGVAFLKQIFSTKNFVVIWYSLIVILIVAAVNAPQYYRNYSVSGNMLGADKNELSMYSNEHMSPVLFLSAIEKNTGLQMGILGFNRIALTADSIIYKLNRAEHVNINDAGNNYGHSTYSTPIVGANHEDSAPNLLHFLLLIISAILICIYCIKNKKNTAILMLLLTVMLQASLICIYLKWQPWNSRLHITPFMLGMPLIGYAVTINRNFKNLVFYAAIPCVLLYAMLIVINNSTRPYYALIGGRPGITTKTPEFNPRYQNYFNNIPGEYPEYSAVNDIINKHKHRNIGLILNPTDYEYPLFATCFSAEINPVNIRVKNYTKNVAMPITVVDCIVSTTLDRPFIDYNGKRFYNQNVSNHFIHLYE